MKPPTTGRDPVERHHHMPFGAETDGDSVRFRLWAPSARHVQLCLQAGNHETLIPMVSVAGGWHECRSRQAQAGTRYRFRLEDGRQVPDPASRFQPDDVHGPSEVVDPRAFPWQDQDWRGRPFAHAVFYELHIGCFTAEGTYAAAARRLPDLVELGVTAVELMPLADFPGARNWGYDGVYPFAPDSRYGRPDELKAFIQRAHALGLMVFLDVVYNHFGPEGNYLHLYAPQFFTERHHTPWGAAINYDDTLCAGVRDFVVHNALYWLKEYHLDGLRLDAVHAIFDDSTPDILEQLAAAVRRGPGAERNVHLVLENDNNAAHYLAGQYDAQWNDDGHHALHVLTTGEIEGYYRDYADDPIRHLGRCLTEGFAFQGDPSPYRDGTRRGEPSHGLPPTAFVNFLQNHDQVGNRALGERVTALAPPEAVRATTAVLLLAPSPPLLFMGQEWAAPEPFPFFCDFGPDLAAAVTAGRRAEFARFPQFREPAMRDRIPDPNDPATFTAAVLDWSRREQPGHREWLAFHHHLLALRHQHLIPLLLNRQIPETRTLRLGSRALLVEWRFSDETWLTLAGNLGPEPLNEFHCPAGEQLYATPGVTATALPAWSVAWYLLPGRDHAS